LNLKSTLTLLALFALPAFSATITFGTGGTSGFTGGGVNSITVNNAAGVTGLSVIVTAGVLSPDSCSSQCWLTTSSAGYGVNNAAPSGGASDSSDDIDGSGADDFISLVFNQQVRITGATFGSFSSSDDGELYNTTSGTVLVTAFDTNSIALNSLGTSFRFQATGTNDAYRLRSVTFVATPEPSTFGLTAAGLMGLWALGRKRLRRVQ
jgi:hypothetical protein